LSARVAELEAQLLEASEMLEKPIGYGVGILCVSEAVKLVLARLAETHTKLNTEMAEHTREVLLHAATQSRAAASSQLAETNARAEAAKTALADRIEHCEKHHSEEIKRQRNYIEALEHDVKYFKEAKENAESRAEAMRKALEKLEWSGHRTHNLRQCPACFGLQREGRHSKRCFIGVALAHALVESEVEK
jgi:hypothetical protein